MQFEEIRPDIFLSSKQTVHHKLTGCRHCGAADTLAHQKYTDKCIECGNKYNMFYVRRSARLRATLTNKMAISYLRMLEDLVVLRDRGFEAFPNLDEEYTETKKIVDNIHDIERRDAALAQYELKSCICCGDKEIPVRVGDPKPVKCRACEETYTRYTELRKRLDELPVADRNELAQIISVYINQQRRGYRVPYFASVLKRLQKLQEADRLPRYKLYGRMGSNENM